MSERTRLDLFNLDRASFGLATETDRCDRTDPVVVENFSDVSLATVQIELTTKSGVEIAPQETTPAEPVETPISITREQLERLLAAAESKDNSVPAAASVESRRSKPVLRLVRKVGVTAAVFTAAIGISATVPRAVMSLQGYADTADISLSEAWRERDYAEQQQKEFEKLSPIEQRVSEVESVIDTIRGLLQ